ncbi:hypothetical protein FOL46_004375 [Perkinsus olseni]|uniref:Uncharacterized protein n=1 Tax=Perkinsus olseni TaxID=32597 RepID=A0A7J6LXZ5_PEROL|nr:hypothetical protein FOL46_004375 [Perkinsus olseni]
MPAVISAMAMRKAASKVGPSARKVSADSDKYHRSCFVEYPLVNVTVSMNNCKRFCTCQDQGFIRAETARAHELFRVTYQQCHKALFVHYKEYMDGYQAVNFEDRGGVFFSYYHETGLNETAAADDPFASLYAAVGPLMAGNITDTNCMEVADYIVNHPGGGYKNDGQTPWVREYALAVE